MPRSILKRLLAAIGVLALAAGVPVLLVRIAGWPLPTRMPDWDRVTTAIRQGDVPAKFVINTLACALWVCWAQLTWSLLWETVAQLRHSHDPPAQHVAPLVPTTMHRTVARIVAFMLSASIAVTSTAKAQPLPPRPAVTAVVPAPAVPEAPRSTLLAEAPQAKLLVTWVVAPGDTVWDIAQVALGDGGRSSEILELNPTISPRHLRVGHQLTLPSGAMVPPDRAPTEAAPAGVPAAAALAYVPASVVTVAPGDNLWSLSESRLDIADGPIVTPSGPAVFGYLQDVLDINTVPSGNPSLIHPGEQFRFPAIGESPPPAPAPPIPPHPVVTSPPAPEPAPTTTPETTPTTSPTSPSSITAPAVDQEREHGGNSDRLLAGITGATALAAGLLVAYRRRRQLAARHGAAALLAPPPERVRNLIEGLVRSADVPLLRWANHQLATLMADLDPLSVTGVPLAAELSDTHGIEVLWDSPQPNAPTPWVATDQGWTWHLPYDPDAPLPSEPSIPPIPGLVTVGTRDGNQLLLNLEAFGTIALTGDPVRAENLARSIVLEVASGEELTGATCTVVGLAVDGDELFWRVDHADMPQALRVLLAHQGSYEQLLDETVLPTAFHTRLGDATDREVHLLVVDETHSVELAPVDVHANRGVAVVTLGDVSDGPQIRLDPDGTATLLPLGVTFTPAEVPVATASELAILLDEADEIWPAHDSTADDAEEVTEARAEVDPYLAVSEDLPEVDEAEGEVWRLPVPEHLVRVLGVPRLDQAPDIGRLELSIIAFLACNGGAATTDQVIDAVWGGKVISQGTFMNRLTRLRNTVPGILPARVTGADRKSVV